MDRFNWNHSTADYNSHEYYNQPYQGYGQSNDHYNQPYQGYGQSNDHYSQPYQEYGQHSSQPETGQTFGGVVESGPSWSYPTPGQPQSYPDSNFPQWIPPSPSLGSDLEYLLRTPQPTPLANILQNDASPELPGPSNAQELPGPSNAQELPGPSNAQPGVKKRRRRDFAEIRELFLAGLDNYAQGCPLKDCSETLHFFQYVTDAGERKADGDSLYTRLEQKDKDRFDQAIADRKACKGGPKVRTSFMEGLNAYANGAPLKDCSETILYDTYVSSKGYLHKRGVKLYNKLAQGDKDRIDDALRARKRFNVERTATTDDSPMDAFLGGLEAYASGALLKDCSANNKYFQYATNDGRLAPMGERLYKMLVGEGKALVDGALAARRKRAAEQISGDLYCFLNALEPYSKGLDLNTCGEQSGLMRRAKMYFTPGCGLTARGNLLIENLQPNEQLEVLNKVELRRQSLDPSAHVPVPVPDSLWQWPETLLPMPEMGGMNQAETVDPMQTEAMRATAWQLTGQAVPGPSTSAEPPIPYYDSEAVGADFQHQLWPGTEPGESWPYADQYPWRGV
ncbi:MAG: hypothetical protein P8X89_19835 [Reinekea sp.]